MPKSAYDLFEGDIGTVITLNMVKDRGEHDGAAGAAVLTDTSAEWVRNEFVGDLLRNISDGSSGTVTANTETTITATLAGGTDNDWDIGDDYEIPVNITSATPLVFHWQHAKLSPVTKTPTIATAINGSLQYTTVVSDIGVGDLRIQAEVTLPSGWNGRSDPVTFKVGRKLIKDL